MFNILKKEPALYKAYLAQQDAERLRKEQEAKAIIEEQHRQEMLNKDSGRVSKVSYRGTAQIGVTSLFHGCGTTYLAEIIAMFLNRYRKGKTCLIETKGLVEEFGRTPVDVATYPCELSFVYKEHYDFIVRDFGLFDAIKLDEYADWERCDHKCVVCWPDEQSLSRLADFVECTEHADEFIYFFNMVPKERTREILDIMVDYKVVILPCTSLDRFDKEFVSTLYSIFGKG